MLMAVVAMILAGLAVQIGALLGMGHRRPVGDEKEYLERGLAEDPYAPRLFLRPPLFSWLARRLRGGASEGSRLRGAMALLSVITVALTAAAGWRLEGPEVAVLATLILLVQPERIVLGCHLWPDNLLAACVAALVLISTSPPTSGTAFAAGIVAMLGVLTRIDFLVALPVLLVIWPGEPIALALLAAPALVALVVLTWHNGRRYGTYLPDTTWAFNLMLLGSAATQRGIEDHVEHHLSRWRRATAGEALRRGFETLIEALRSPGRLVLGALRRLLVLLGPDTFIRQRLLPSDAAYPDLGERSRRLLGGALRIVFPLLVALVTVLVLAGERPKPWTWPALALMVPAIVFHARTRFRLLLLPVLSLWLAIGLLHTTSPFGDQPLALGLGGVGVLLLVGLLTRIEVSAEETARVSAIRGVETHETRDADKVVVLGMHRSGTSALMALLQRLGFHVGSDEELMPANAANPLGFWERRDVVDLNNHMLCACGGNWLSVVDLDLAAEGRSELRVGVRKVLGELDAHPPWALKDPRMCLTLPIWRPALGEAVCLLIYRHPMDVAVSLAKRDDLPVPFGLALWEQYTLNALRHSQGLPRLLIAFGGLLEDPTATARDLHRQLVELGFHDLAEPDRGVAEVIDTRHAGSSTPEDGRLSNAQERLYEALEDGSALCWETVPELSLESRELLQGLAKTSFTQVPELEREIDERTRWAQDLGTTVEEREATIRELQAALEDRTGWARELAKTVEERETTIRELQDALASRTEWAQDLARTVEEREAAIRELQDAFASRSEWASELSRTVEDRESTVRELQSELESRTEWAQDLARLLDERETAIRHLQAQLAAESG